MHDAPEPVDAFRGLKDVAFGSVGGLFFPQCVEHGVVGILMMFSGCGNGIKAFRASV